MKTLSLFTVMATFSILLAGCAAGVSCSWIGFGCHDFWKETRDGLIGSKFDPSRKLVYSSVPQGEEYLYRIEQEPPNTRYYIKWKPHCKYSLLVDPESTVLSWQFEDNERSCRII
jgi:hypothetical protein